MTDLLDTHVYALIGEDGFRRLVTAFYRRVPTDDILGPMYPKHDLAGADLRWRPMDRTSFLVLEGDGAKRVLKATPVPRAKL